MLQDHVGPYGSKEFAATRSHQDALVSNENARAAAQAAILINGGAATAVLAFLSKDKIDPYFLNQVPFALVGYAFGVFFGSLMVFCAAQALKYWGLAWRIYMINVKDKKSSDRENALANKWNTWTQFAFVASMFCFIVASIALAVVLYLAPHSAIAAKVAS